MKTRGIILITFLSILPLLGLIHPGLPVTHDGQDHVARIANFFLSLTEGNLVPRWAENLNWGYGHPIMMFLYPLPSYMASIFHLFGLGFVDSTKIVFAVSFIFSGIFMYLWLSEFLGEIPAISGAILYNFAPYRFVDLYVRGAIGEHVAFIFPPLVAYFILKLSKKNKRHKWYIVGLALSTACLILAHNAMSLMFLPFLFVYAIYLFLLNRNFVFLGKSIGGIALGFLLSAFFWIPAFLEGRYTLRDIVVGDEVFKRFVDVPSLIYGPWSYGITGQFSVQVGILQWVAFLFSIPILFIAYKKNKNIFILLCITLIYFLGSLFIMLPVSTFVWKSISIIQKFQFPWRFLSISVFSIAIIGAVVMDYIPKKLQSILLILMLAFLAIFNRDYWLPKGYLAKPELFYSGIYNGTTDTGESSPIWSVRFMEKRPAAEAEVIEGSANIRKISRTSTEHIYQISSAGKARIRENTLYFPGWNVYVDGNKYTSLQFQDPVNRGIMTFYLTSGTHRVDVIFQNTRLRTLSNTISVGALVFLVAVLLGFKTKLKKDK